MLKNVYEGLNARPKVYLSKEHFCEMYPTCVSSKLCEFICDEEEEEFHILVVGLSELKVKTFLKILFFEQWRESLLGFYLFLTLNKFSVSFKRQEAIIGTCFHILWNALSAKLTPFPLLPLTHH